MKNNLKTTRVRAGYSQKEIADLLNVSKSSVSLWESGKVSPSNEALYTLSKLYGVSMESLLDMGNTSQINEDSEIYKYQIKEKEEVMIPLLVSIKCIGKKNSVIKYIPVPHSYISKYGNDIVGVMATGHSMSPTITQNDCMICIPGSNWENGNIVIVDINDGETIKRIHHSDDGGFDLIPENKDFSVMHLTPAEVDKYNVRVLARIVRSISPEL